MAWKRSGSSIIRRTTILASIIPIIFILDFLTTYWSNQRIVDDLQTMWLANDRISAVSTMASDLNAATDSLRSFVAKPDGAKRAAFLENLRQAEEFTGRLVPSDSSRHARESLASLRRLAETEFRTEASPKSLKANLLVADQFSLELDELLRKRQIELRAQSDTAFRRVYAGRWFPLAVTSVLDLVFFGLLLFLIVPLLRNLTRSVSNLGRAADRIVNGESEYQAPILTDDELGRATETFNRVVSALNQKERESKQRAEAEIARLEFISRSASELAQSLDLDSILDRLARATVSYLADWCVVDVLEEDGRVRRVAGAVRDPVQEPVLKKLMEDSPKRIGESRILTEVSRVERAYRARREEIENLLSSEWPGRGAVSALGLASVLALPIRVRDRVAAVMILANSRDPEAYGRPEWLLGEDLARRAGYAIENAQSFLEAKQAIQTRDDFLSIASHELRTPLTPLRMQIQMLARALKRGAEFGPGTVERALDTSERMITRLARLVEDLLEVSRINSGRLELRYEEGDFAETIRDVLTRFRPEIERQKVTLDAKIPDHIPGRWDLGKVEQIFVNLLTNAVKYGGGKPISVEVDSDDEFVRLRVRDRGIGIRPEDRDRIFGRFERASGKDSVSGLGLGLYITAQIVELHRGRVRVDSKVGEGSTFVVELPRRGRPAEASASP